MSLTPKPDEVNAADRLALELVEIVTAHLAARGVGLGRERAGRPAAASIVNRELTRAEHAIDELEVSLIRIREATSAIGTER